MTNPQHKKICLATCSLSFYTKVSNLAKNKQVNIADLARSIFILLPREVIAQFPDPGDSKVDERIKQGSIRRKPRIQIRLPNFETASMIRRALACYCFMQEIDSKTKAEIFKNILLDQDNINKDSIENIKKELTSLQKEIQALQGLVKEINLTNLKLKISTKEQAFMIFGFTQDNAPSLETAHKRYKKLATAFHPDGLIGNNEKMVQINSAWKIIKSHLYHHS